MGRVVAHLDLDAFFAAVEVLENPALAGLPLVVGGDPDRRGVVATASYEARAFGIRSAMSSADARRRCPSAIFIRPDHARYQRWSRRVWDLVAGAAPVVEQVGIDEGYLDLSGVAETAGQAERLLAELQTAVRVETGLSCALGCGTGKVIAKIASDFRKPGGITVVPAGREAAFLAPLPLRRLPGVGPRAEERLVAAGLATVGDLAALDDARLALLLPGAVGRELRERARGDDPRPVQPPGPGDSISVEETFDWDIADAEVLVAEAERMAHEVAARLGRDGRAARTVTVKLRYPDFRIATRAASAPTPFRDVTMIAMLARQALGRALGDRPPPVRLLGVGVSRLGHGEQLRLPIDDVVA